MKQLMLLYKKDLIELYRTKRILIIAAIFIIFAMASPLIAKIMPDLLISIGGIEIELPPSTIADSYDQLGQNLSQFGALVIVGCFGSLIVNERRKGLYNNLLNNGVKKYNFITAKFLSQITVITIIYLIACLFFSLYNYIIFDAFLVKYSLIAFFALYIYLIFAIAITNFYSTLSKSGMVSFFLSFGTIMLIMIFELFKFGKYLPNHLVNIAINLFKDDKYMNYAWYTISLTALLCLILYTSSIVICKNKDK